MCFPARSGTMGQVTSIIPPHPQKENSSQGRATPPHRRWGESRTARVVRSGRRSSAPSTTQQALRALITHRVQICGWGSASKLRIPLLGWRISCPPANFAWSVRSEKEQRSADEITAAGQGYCYFRTVWPFYFPLSAGLILRTTALPFPVCASQSPRPSEITRGLVAPRASHRSGYATPSSRTPAPRRKPAHDL